MFATNAVKGGKRYPPEKNGTFPGIPGGSWKNQLSKMYETTPLKIKDPGGGGYPDPWILFFSGTPRQKN